MTTDRTMRRLSLCAALALWLLATTPAVWTRVVNDFGDMEHCKDSLYMGTPPLGYLDHKLKKICQVYGNKPRYITLYDPQKHIPVYSAYTFKKTNTVKRVDFPWMYEPQLAWERGGANMEPFPVANMHMNFEDTQAVLGDFSNSDKYVRGHLNPDEHQDNPSDKAATYTLTNVIPQVRELNFSSWSKYTELIRQRLNNYCQGMAYVVTGVTNSGNMIRRDNVDRVAIPEFIWSAYCCTAYDQNMPYFIRYKFPTFGAFVLNDPINSKLTEVPLINLEKFLKKKMNVNGNFQIFYSNCVISP